MVPKEVGAKMAASTLCRHQWAKAARSSILYDRLEVAKRKAKASRERQTQSLEMATRRALLDRHRQLNSEDGQQGKHGERQVAPGPMPDKRLVPPVSTIPTGTC